MHYESPLRLEYEKLLTAFWNKAEFARQTMHFGRQDQGMATRHYKENYRVEIFLVPTPITGER